MTQDLSLWTEVLKMPGILTALSLGFIFLVPSVDACVLVWAAVTECHNIFCLYMTEICFLHF